MDARIRKIAGLLDLNDKLNREPFTLSRGERQRVALASVLAMETDILILDEPTTGQDYRECIGIMDIIRDLNRQGKTIIMVTHDIEIAADFCGRTVILHQGRVLEDDATGIVLRKPESLKMAGLEPPQIIQLALRFGSLFQKVSSPEEMAEAVISCAMSGGVRV